MVGYDRTVLVDVLVHHWPTRSNGCECGWAKLGASYPEHVVDVYESAMAESLASGGLVQPDVMPLLGDRESPPNVVPPDVWARLRGEQ